MLSTYVSIFTGNTEISSGSKCFSLSNTYPQETQRRIVGKGEVLRRGQSPETQSKINT